MLWGFMASLSVEGGSQVNSTLFLYMKERYSHANEKQTIYLQGLAYIVFNQVAVSDTYEYFCLNVSHPAPYITCRSCG